ncbi:hypothetical protein [Streptomyces sp. NPDC050560]|uniref:hypothetical protein n=1 Tax=Streptomyces sp. NPDC050560 TaxID=3365630 RepID=UPI0037B54397
MQQPAVPELAHTHTQPIHWVATATAIAAVIAASSYLGPDDATAQPHHRTGTARHSAPPRPVPAPDPDRASYPLECGGAKTVVEKSASGDLDGDGRPETVASVRCDAGSGTPPDGVYVLTNPGATGGTGSTGEHGNSTDTAAPRVVATLVDPKARLTVTGVTIDDLVVTTDVLGYSSPDVPSCCPDVRQQTSWRWSGGTFRRVTPDSARSA